MSQVMTSFFLKELNNEYPATKKCLERIPETLFKYKPHETSMELGYLALLVAEIPLWIKYMLTEGEIDFVTFPHFQAKTTAELVQHLDANMQAARTALQGASDEELEGLFSLKRNGELLYTTKKIPDIPTSINHWVHHRGQLVVYMRMNDLEVPSLYGPSGDDRSFKVPK